MAFRRLWLLLFQAVAAIANRIPQADVSWLGFCALRKRVLNSVLWIINLWQHCTVTVAVKLFKIE